MGRGEIEIDAAALHKELPGEKEFNNAVPYHTRVCMALSRWTDADKVRYVVNGDKGEEYIIEKNGYVLSLSAMGFLRVEEGLKQ